MSAPFWRRGKLAIARVLRLDLTHCQRHYANFLHDRILTGARWLEIGCGRQIVPEYAMTRLQQKEIADRASFLVGVDMDEAILHHPLLHARTIADCRKLPFGDGSFNLVTANMVVEHFHDPASALAEVHRVLQPGGRFIFHTPNYLNYLIFVASLTPDCLKDWLVWVLERRREEDRFKTYYRLNTKRRIAQVAKDTGFMVETVAVNGSNGTFGRLGPLGWVECFVLKALDLVHEGDLRENLIVSLLKTTPPPLA